MKIKIPEDVELKMKVIEGLGHKVFVVGGAVRDCMLGEEPHDWDLFTNCPCEVLLKIFPKGVVIGGQERQEKILTVIVDDVEISEFRLNGDRTLTGSTIEQHCKTCDFTINALCVDSKGEVYDYVGGMADLHNRVLRFVGDAYARISEDPLRALRGIRFLAKFDLTPEYLTKDVLLNTWGHIVNLPKERIRDEVLKIMEEDSGATTLAQYKVLTMMIPELNKCAIEGGEHHDELVLQHLMYAYESAKGITDDKRIWLAALLHDIGKPKSVSYDKDKNIHFYQHHKIGADIVRDWMNEYKFSQKDTDFVCTLIYEHMWTNRDGNPSKKGYVNHFKYMEDKGVDVMDYIKLIYCDHQGNMSHERIKFGDFVQSSDLKTKYDELKFSKVPFCVKDLEVKGEDVMNFGIPAGKIVGAILKEIYKRVMNGEVENNRPQLMHELKGLCDVKLVTQ